MKTEVKAMFALAGIEDQREQMCKAAGSEDLPSSQYTFEDAFLQPGWSWSQELHAYWHLDCNFQFSFMQKKSNLWVQEPVYNVNQSMITKEGWEMHCRSASLIQAHVTR